MGLARHQAPIYVEIKTGAEPVKVASTEGKRGITPHRQRLLKLGVLKPTQSAWNTALLPVKKPHINDYYPVQDFREVNKRKMDTHPTVPNPYTLLSTLSPDPQWYTTLDLRDAFFSLPLSHPWPEPNLLCI